MTLLSPGDQFPALSMTLPGGGTVTLPGALAGEFSVILFYRGSWCPTCASTPRRRRDKGRMQHMSEADIHFYFDPVCPFAWMTSKWVRMVQAQRDYTVDWRFISLRMINAAVDYDSNFPAGYEAGHTAGLRLLRVAARTRAEHGRGAVGQLYEALGVQIFDTAAEPGHADDGYRGTRAFTEPVLAEAGLPAGLADALH